MYSTNREVELERDQTEVLFKWRFLNTSDGVLTGYLTALAGLKLHFRRVTRLRR